MKKKKLPNKKIPCPERIIVEFSLIFKGELTRKFLKLFHKVGKKQTFYKVSITLIPKCMKTEPKKKKTHRTQNYKPFFLIKVFPDENQQELQKRKKERGTIKKKTSRKGLQDV